MDEFTTSARQGRLRGTLVVGATFGIFLTIGNAWNEFLQAAVEAMVPAQESNVLTQLLYATFATVLCLLLLVCLIKTDRYVNVAEKKMTRKNLTQVVRKMPGVVITEKRVEDDEEISTVPRRTVGMTPSGQTRRTRNLVRQGR